MSGWRGTMAGACWRRQPRARFVCATGAIPMTDQHLITSLDALERIYGEPHGNALAKETDRITPHYRAFIEAAPFFALSSAGPAGLDCSAGGDASGLRRVDDVKTLSIAHPRGHHRDAP